MSFKRQAETELNQDNVHEMDKEVSDKAKHDTWKRAPEEVLATRKILKVSDSFSSAKPKDTSNTTAASGGGGFAAYAKVNPFAAMGPPMGFGASASKSTAAPSITAPNSTKTAATAAPVPSTSPKVNPFVASNPAPNPFMNFVSESKPNVDYWQKFKEPVKVPASDVVSSSDVKVTFVSPSSNANKQQPPQSYASAGVFNASVTKSSSDNITTASNSSSPISSSSPSKESSVSAATSTQDVSATTSTQDDDDKDNNDDEEDTNESSSSVISEKKPAIDTAAMFNKPAELDNGEAGEECVLKLRAKLYRLSESTASTAAAKEWVEVGTGPVRLLTPSSSSDPKTEAPPLFPRIVMRREHQAGGPGTKVILNASFRSHFSVAKMGERAARLTCLAAPPPEVVSKGIGAEDEDGKKVEKEDKGSGAQSQPVVAIPMTYLFKMQHSHEADQFIKHITGFQSQQSKEKEK